MQSKTDSTAIIHYKSQGRRPSIATLQDTAINKTSEFCCKQLIARNKNCRIRLFRNSSGETIVIKSPQSDIKMSSFETNDAPYGLNLGPYVYPHDEIWSYRLVMPYITGQTFNEYASIPHKNYFWLLFFMAIAIELNCIHQRGVIHGDVRAENGFVKYNIKQHRFDIHFIDFGSAYLVNDAKEVITVEKGSHTQYWAPERRLDDVDNDWPKPDVKQDVYSYGHMLLDFMQVTPAFKELHPKFVSTIEATQNENPNDRPGLTTIINQLRSM